MSRELEQFHEARRMLPLLRSYATEIGERRSAVKRHARGLDALRGEKVAPTDPVRTAELAANLRELRRIDKELDRLGWYCDHDEPLRFYLRGKNGEPDVMWTPAEHELAALVSIHPR